MVFTAWMRCPRYADVQHEWCVRERVCSSSCSPQLHIGVFCGVRPVPAGIAINMDLSASIFSACEDAKGRPLSMIEVIKSVRWVLC